MEYQISLGKSKKTPNKLYIAIENGMQLNKHTTFYIKNT